VARHETHPWLYYKGDDGRSYQSRGNEEFVLWEEKHQDLFQAGVIRRLDKPTRLDHKLQDILGRELNDICVDIFSTQNVLKAGERLLYVHQAQIEHLLRKSISGPSIFAPAASRSSREIFKLFEAQEVFRIVLPRIAEGITPDQVLHIRDKVKDTREGFAMHLQSLSADVQSALSSGASLPEIAEAARDVVETKLVPDYSAFRRQLSAKEGKFWGRVLDPLGKILAIDAAPWTPKFWGGFLSALGSAFGIGAEVDADSFSNEQQAFQFLRTLEATELSRPQQ
jgi:hypothetical protein